MWSDTENVAAARVTSPPAGETVSDITVGAVTSPVKSVVVTAAAGPPATRDTTTARTAMDGGR